MAVKRNTGSYSFKPYLVQCFNRLRRDASKLGLAEDHIKLVLYEGYECIYIWCYNYSIKKNILEYIDKHLPLTMCHDNKVTSCYLMMDKDKSVISSPLDILEKKNLKNIIDTNGFARVAMSNRINIKSKDFSYNEYILKLNNDLYSLYNKSVHVLEANNISSESADLIMSFNKSIDFDIISDSVFRFLDKEKEKY